jgi:predicted lipoprotein with Yx(FWY)xxD motif
MLTPFGFASIATRADRPLEPVTAPHRSKRRSITRLVAVALTIAAGCVVPTATARQSADSTAGAALVKVARTSLGPILVDGRGRTLYLLTADARAKGKSVCYAACAKAWPPLLTRRAPKAGPGVKASLLGVANRTDGTRQVTYAGRRLYLFVKDTKAGQTAGEKLEGFGGPFCTASLATKPCVWYAVSPAGTPATRRR